MIKSLSIRGLVISELLKTWLTSSRENYFSNRNTTNSSISRVGNWLVWASEWAIRILRRFPIIRLRWLLFWVWVSCLSRRRWIAGPLGLLGDPVHGELARLLRSSNYVVVKWAPSPSLSVTTTSYYQVDTRRLADYRMLSQSQARLGLTEKLALNFTLNLRYDSEPPANIENLDLEFSQGLTYSF